MSPRTAVALLCLPCLLFAGAGPHAPSERPRPTRTQVADGVHLFTTPGYGDVGLDGNSVAIITGEGVLVFDTNGTPDAAEKVLAGIRELTSQPVRYVVNSHWHWDHWYGTEVYRRAFPEARIVSHRKTREMMLGPALAFNKPGLEIQLPEYIRALETRLADAEAKTGSATADTARLRRLVEDDRFFLEQKRGVRHTLPDLTFTNALDIHLGGRLIQVRHVDRAVTPGDAFLYLPAEKLLVTGDLLVNPVSFALSCYPEGWVRTLEQLERLDTSVIVPGHGEPLRDKQLLRDTLSVFRTLRHEGAAARARGVDVDEARIGIMTAIAREMRAITKGDPAVSRAFEVQLVDWFLHRVYEEAAGPLDDRIAAIPPK